ncbi:2-C-methyl-D-erythritol 4-phosphate cytidylyltransferase [Corynebacterium bovis]|uniref:2-C-methyl-D-erythritol 4-phosphate cytidylyltransferase n=1 Tax=Corynebacterium bovis TaxID=36808 RepID=UPI003139AD33
MRTDRVHALVPAAGSGTRLGAAVPKALVELDGRALLLRALDGLAASGVVGDALVIVSGGMLGEVDAALRGNDWGPMRVAVCRGGAERADSVRAGLRVLTDRLGDEREGHVVAVHDAARCLTPPALVRDVVAAAVAGPAAGAVPVVPVTDTVKTVAPGPGGTETVTGTPDRATLRAVQTPQVFALPAFIAAHERVTGPVTDDASLVERAGFTVAAVPGDPRALKITTPTDLALARVLLGGEETP